MIITNLQTRQDTINDRGPQIPQTVQIPAQRRPKRPDHVITTLVQSRQELLHPLQRRLRRLHVSALGRVTHQPEKIGPLHLWHRQTRLVTVVYQTLRLGREQLVEYPDQGQHVGQKGNDVRSGRVTTDRVPGFGESHHEPASGRSFRVFRPGATFHRAQQEVHAEYKVAPVLAQGVVFIRRDGRAFV